MYVLTQMFFLVDQSRQFFQKFPGKWLDATFFMWCDVYAFFFILALPMLTRWDRYLNKMKIYFFQRSDLFEFSLLYMILPNLLSLLFSRLLPILQVLVPTYLQRWGGASNRTPQGK